MMPEARSINSVRVEPKTRRPVVNAVPMATLFVAVLAFTAVNAKPESETSEAVRLSLPSDLISIELAPRNGHLLRGRDARRQLVATGIGADGAKTDISHLVTYATSPEAIVEVSDSGYVTPLANGKTSVIALLEQEKTDALRSELEVEVVAFDTEVPTNFPNQIVPIFTKYGCNGGGCHGKSGGQNGFRLSLLGFYPDEDYEFLVHESRGRRVSPLSPEHSLLLRKATNEAPHGGGERITRESHEYRLLRRWMRQGMPYGSADDPTVVGIEVFPTERTMEKNQPQQLSVLAHYSDGTMEDVTRMAQYESNDTEMAEVDANGLVETRTLPGVVAVMVRYQGNVGVFRASVPLGAPVELPPANNFIDEHIFAKLETLGIPPSDLATDEAFLRRVSVDIAGRLPTAPEAREFLADTSSDKRKALIERLVASTDYADNFANKWSAVLRNKKFNDQELRATYAFYGWIRAALLANKPYDQFVREIVAASGDVVRHPPVTWFKSVRTQEQRVEDTAQLFLGLRIQCARCHHHPFEIWSQKDYYSFAAFFSQVGQKDGRRGVSARHEPRIYHKRGIATATNPRSGEKLRPAGLGGTALQIAADRDPRQELASWMGSEDNPFFARALVNRYWKHFFGRGLVEPEDDLRLTNPASHPKLLDALASQFIESGFDLKELVRTITRSRTYQLSALPNEHNQKDKQNYSRYYPQRLKAEVLYDALHQVTDNKRTFAGLPAGTRALQLPDAGVDNYFLKVFGKPKGDSSCECERSQDASLAQSLHLLNSKEIHDMLTADAGRAASFAKETERPVEKRVEDLYYWVYSRAPTGDETKVALTHLEKTEKPREAFEDIIWALVNTKEFLFNH